MIQVIRSKEEAKRQANDGLLSRQSFSLIYKILFCLFLIK